MKLLKSSLFMILAAVLIAAPAAPASAQTSQGSPKGEGRHFGHRGPPPSELNTSGETSSSTARPGKFRKPPTAEEKAKMEANLKSWAEENNYTTSTDENGRLVVKDAEGNMVRPPRPGRGRPEPTAEQKEKMEASLKAWAEKNGYTTEAGEDGRLIVKDSDGNIVKPGRGEHGQPPSAEEIAKIEAKITAWAQENGYTTEKDERGRLIAKDQDGKMVMPPRDILGAPPAPPAPPAPADDSSSGTTDSTSSASTSETQQ